jgi:hypothetical protein
MQRAELALVNLMLTRNARQSRYIKLAMPSAVPCRISRSFAEWCAMRRRRSSRRDVTRAMLGSTCWAAISTKRPKSKQFHFPSMRSVKYLYGNSQQPLRHHFQCEFHEENRE